MVMQNRFETNEWARLIGRIMISKGLNHAQIGKAAGVHQTTVSRIYAGSIPDPRASVALKLIVMAGGVVNMPLGDFKEISSHHS